MWEPPHDRTLGTGSADCVDLFSPSFRFLETGPGADLTGAGWDAGLHLPTTPGTGISTH